MNRETVLDVHHLARATGGDRSLMGELLDMLRVELTERGAQLAGALDAGDGDAAAGIAHKLQGSAAYTGAFQLEAAAARLEDALRAGDPEPARTARAELERAMETLRRELESGAALIR